jgi:prepilin-type N-terminal cleavage/methylation domain-containing protein/prepilin-type processing-associated H-X9-DG protein
VAPEALLETCCFAAIDQGGFPGPVHDKGAMMRSKPMLRQQMEAFTLIEVLVVVAIMALLLSILLPSLKNARNLAKATVCGTQMNELFKATLMYSHSYDDRLPYFGWYDSTVTGREWWATQLAKIINNQYDLYRCPSDDRPAQMDVVKKRGRLYMSSTTEAGSFKLDVSYRSACDTLESYKGGYRSRKITSWKRPYSAICMVEANINTGTDNRECFRFKDDLKVIANPAEIQAHPYLKSWLRHLGKSNLMFIDGHVSRLTPKQAAALAPLQEHYLQ